MDSREQKIVEVHPSQAPEIGRWLWAFQDTRQLTMDLADFRRVRTLPHYDVTPEWVLHHLMQHEAEHRSQLGALRARAERALATRS